MPAKGRAKGRGRKTRAAGAAQSRPGPSHSLALVMLLVAMGMLIVFLPTTLVLVVALVPTLAAFIIDVTPGRYACRCVAGLNVAGLLPYLHKLWTGSNDMDGAAAIVSDPYAWLVFYGAAAVGWMLFLGVPGLVATIQVLDAKRRVNVFRDRQEQLLVEWGADVRDEATDLLARTEGNPVVSLVESESRDEEDSPRRQDADADDAAPADTAEPESEPA